MMPLQRAVTLVSASEVDMQPAAPRAHQRRRADQEPGSLQPVESCPAGARRAGVHVEHVRADRFHPNQPHRTITEHRFADSTDDAQPAQGMKSEVDALINRYPEMFGAERPRSSDEPIRWPAPRERVLSMARLR